MINIDNCFGCGACAQSCPQKCIELKENAEGFLSPIVDEKNCIGCGICNGVCQMENNDWKQNTEVIKKAYLFANMNEYYRNLSSSGGFFVAVSNWVLDRGGVIFGAAFTEDFMVSHKYVTNKIDLFALMGSKYVQSDLKNTFSEAKEFLKQGSWVLFSGTPCQIGALNEFLKEEDTSRLVLVDFVCHGVPSTKVWREYLNECHNQDIRYINFREKRIGWWEYEFRIQYAKGEYTSKYRGGNDPYIDLFLKKQSLNRTCYDCKYRDEHKYSDFFIGDAWNINRIKNNMDDDRGITIVFVNSAKGEAIIKELQNNNIFEIEIDEAIKYRTELFEPSIMPKGRKVFFDNLEKGFRKAYEKVND